MSLWTALRAGSHLGSEDIRGIQSIGSAGRVRSWMLARTRPTALSYPTRQPDSHPITPEYPYCAGVYKKSHDMTAQCMMFPLPNVLSRREERFNPECHPRR